MNVAPTDEHTTLVVDEDSHEVFLDGQSVDCTIAEFLLLSTLARQPRRAFSNEYLTQILTGSTWTDDHRVLQVTVSRLRRKLGESGRQPRHIINIHGFGYRFEPGTEPASESENQVQQSCSPTRISRPSAVIVTSPQHIIAWTSDSVLDLLGWQPGEMSGYQGVDFVHMADLDKVAKSRETTELGVPDRMVVRLLGKDDHYCPLDVQIVPQIDDKANVVSYVTELRPAQSGLLPWPPPSQPIRLLDEPLYAHVA